MTVSDAELSLVAEALSGVYDPELGLDVVSLGLVYGVEDEDGKVVVEMTLTTPGCPVSESLPKEASAAVAGRLGPAGRESEVRIVWDPPWSPDLMSEQAAAALGSQPRRAK